MQAEYIKQNEMVLRLQMAQEIALEQASLQQMMTTESALEEPQRQTDSPSNKLSKTMRSVGRKKSASAAGSQAKELASKKLNTAVAGATQKALGAIPGVGAALAGGHIALSKMIGEKNTNKLMLFLGGGAAAGIGYVVAKTLQALQTLGGMIGGAVGGFAGSFLGIGGTVVGFIGGANLGAAAQNWLAGIFGKGAGASTTSFGSSGLGGSVLSGGSSLPTLSAPSAASVAQGATTVTNAAGNVVGGITKAVGQATQSLPSASAVATQPLASTPFLEGLKAASQAGAKLIYSIPFMSVILGMSIPALYTIIVFLVIMGAFLVPMPFTINSSNPSISEYALISKTASPEEIENNVEEDITYVINIVPKSGYQLEIKRVDDEFLVLGGDATTPTSPLSLTSFEAGKFSSRQEAEYTVTLSGEDALVINTVTFTVDVFDSSGKLVTQGESISALGLVIIGDPPIGCFEFAPAGITTNYEGGSNTSIEWNQQDIVKFLKAFINRVGTNPQYLSLLCSEGDITVHKWPAHPEHFWGWQVNENKIGFYAEFFDASTQWMEYTLVHESGHLINDRNPGLQNQFTQIQTDAGCFTYPFPGRCSESEAFAEALVDYVVWQTHSFSFEGVWTGVFPFKTMYPSEYAWMQTNIFGGIEY